MTGTGERLTDTHVDIHRHTHTEAGWRRAVLGFTVTCYTILRLPAPGPAHAPVSLSLSEVNATSPGWRETPNTQPTHPPHIHSHQKQTAQTTKSCRNKHTHKWHQCSFLKTHASTLHPHHKERTRDHYITNPLRTAPWARARFCTPDSANISLFLGVCVRRARPFETKVKACPVQAHTHTHTLPLAHPFHSKHVIISSTAALHTTTHTDTQISINTHTESIPDLIWARAQQNSSIKIRCSWA